MNENEQPSLSSLYLCFVLQHTQCGTLLFSHLPKREIIQLTLVSKQLSMIARDFINNNYAFHLQDNTRVPTLQYKKIVLSNVDSVDRFHSNRSITQITLGKKFSSPITLPQPNLTHVSFTHKFTHSLKVSSHITHLTLHNFSHKKIQLPPSITHFTFLGNFLHPEFNKKIPNITHLTLLCSCEFSIEDFPLNITHLKFIRSTESSVVDFRPIERISPFFQCFTVRGYNFYIPYHTKGFGFPVLPQNESNEANQMRKTRFEFDPSNLISQLIIAANLFDILDIKSVLQLSLVSKTLFKYLFPLIEENCFFNYFTTTVRIPVIYKPKKAKLNCLESEPRLRHPPRLLNRLIKNLPLSTTHLQFCNHFDKRIDNLIPQSVTNLTFGASFNHLINSILHPNLTNLKNLTLGYIYDKPLDNLPPNLTHLTINQIFNKPVDHLPPSLIYLKFDFTSKFNHLIDHLPINLTTLITGIFFNSPIDNLPPNLTALFLGRRFNQHVNRLPPNLKTLEFGQNAYDIHFGSRFNLPINHLPPNLTTLILGLEYNHHIDSLPSTLKNLTMGFHFNHNIDTLPPTVTNLKMSHKFNQPIKTLPESLQYFKLGFHFNRPINDLLFPTNLTHLKFSYHFNQKIPHFPPHLKYLKLGFRFNQRVQSLPPSVTHLSVSVKYVHSFSFLPLSLQHLIIKPTPPKNDPQVYQRETKKEATLNFDLYLKNLTSFQFCDVKIL